MAACPLGISLVSNAQPTKDIPRIGYVSSQTPDWYLESFRQRLRELGYLEGSNLVFELRRAEGRLKEMPGLVRDLIEKNVSVLVLLNLAALDAARKTGTTIPIVTLSSIDPVKSGLVASLAKPGGNITGLTNLQRDLNAKRLELVREIFPRLSRLAILWDANGPGPKVAFAEYQAVAKSLKLHVQSLALQGPAPDLEAAFQAAVTEKAEALIVVSNPMLGAHLATVTSLAMQRRIPLISENENWANAGALISYGASLRELGRRFASLTHRILQGAKPSDLPFEQSTVFEMVLNMKAAKALGITIPPTIQVRATKVVE